MLSPKSSIDMAIQSQALSVHMWNKLIIYITMHKQKAAIYKLSRSKAPKTQQI